MTHRLLTRLLATRFATISILLHAIFVLMVGGTVLYRVTAEPPDFEASGSGILVEEKTELPPVPAVTAATERTFLPPVPTLAAPLTALLTTAQAPTWKVAAAPIAPAPGISDSMKGALSALGDRAGPTGGVSAAGGPLGTGRAGGTRTAMIFGKKVMANKLGVILDVSGSAHPRLAGAVTEIQSGFADATLILYPGCGMTQFTGNSGHEIRKFSAITSAELKPDSAYFTTAGQITKALKIDAFAQMTSRPSVKDTLFVSWCAGGGPEGAAEKLIGRTQVAFDDLIKRGVDTIYWFADFADVVDPRVVDRLSSQLQSRRIRLHVHNFAGKPVNPEIVALVEKTGGTVNTEKTY